MLNLPESSGCCIVLGIEGMELLSMLSVSTVLDTLGIIGLGAGLDSSSGEDIFGRMALCP